MKINPRFPSLHNQIIQSRNMENAGKNQVLQVHSSKYNEKFL